MTSMFKAVSLTKQTMNLSERSLEMRISLSIPVAFSVLLVCGSAFGFDQPYPRTDLLIEPETVAKAEYPRGTTILDARKRADFEAGHVPSAIWVNHDNWSKSFGDGNDARFWSEAIGSLGIDSTTPVIVYDDNFSNDSSRIWWILKYWGVKDVRLLNGGWKSWSLGKLPQESAVRPVKAVKFMAKASNERLASKEQLLESLKTGSLQIVDARSEAEHCGTEALKNKKAGSVPDARHLEWIDLIDKTTGRFKPVIELRKTYDAAGIDLNRPTATHCQGGGRAAVMAFGMELMGAKNVRNYYRSWSEWGNADDTPVIKPPPKASKR